MAIRDLPGIPGTLYEPGERKDNERYVYRFGIFGRDREVAIYEKNAGAAIRSAVQVYERIRQGGEPEPVRTFAGVADMYLAAVDAGRNETRYVNRLKAHFGHRLIGTIRPADIAEAAARLYPGCKNETKNRQVYTPCASILHWAAENEWIPYLRIRKLKEAQPERRRPKPGTADKLLDNTTGCEKALLAVLICQGWRITETLGLEWDHVDLQHRTMALYISKARQWKAIAMHDEVHDALASLKADEGRVFPWKDRHAVYKWLRPLCKRLGVRFTPHMARHDFASSLREAGRTPRDLVDIGTWTSEKSTAAYDTATEGHKRAILAAFRGGNRGKAKKA